MSLDDPEVVRAQYATEDGLETRPSVLRRRPWPHLDVDAWPGWLGKWLAVGGDAFEVEGDRRAHVCDALVQRVRDACAAWKVR